MGHLLNVLEEDFQKCFVRYYLWTVPILISEHFVTLVEFRYTSNISCCFRTELEDSVLLKNHR